MPSIRKPKLAVLDIVSRQTYTPRHVSIKISYKSHKFMKTYHISRFGNAFGLMLFLCRSIRVNLNHFLVHVLQSMKFVHIGI